MADVALLRHQLIRPTERPQWVLPAKAATPPTLSVRFVNCTHALLALVSMTRADGGPALSPDSVGDDQAVVLHSLPEAGGRQTLSAPAQADGATHVLVMGWARVPPPPQSWDRFPFRQPFSLETMSLRWTLQLPEVNLALAQAAIHLLWVEDRSSIEYSLLAWPVQT